MNSGGMNRAGLVSQPPPNRMQRRQVQQQRAGQVIVTVCAILLGVAVAYVFLSAGPFKAPAGGESIELASGTTARAHLLGTSGGGRTATRARTVGGGSGEEDAWFKKLSSSGCKNTEELRVCSHRAKSTEFPDIFPGSLGAYSALWKAKVKCFDIDFVATSDGQLIASHPDDLQHALKPAGKWAQLAAGAHSLEEIRAAGADEERFPLMEHVLQALAKLLDAEEDKFWVKEGKYDYSRLPAIFMDLKGPAFTKDAVARIAREAADLRIAPHVAVFVMTPEQEALAAAAGYQVPLIRGYMDKKDPNPTLSAAGLASYAMLGPSIHMADAFFKRAVELEKPVHVWTVDSPPALHRALEMGVDSVISNRPLALREVLFDWRDKCSDLL